MTALTNFLRAVAALIFVGLLSAGSWLGYQRLSTPDPRLVAAEKELADERARGEKLKTDLAAKEKEVARLDTAVRLLKVDRRVARIDVLEQWTPENSDRPHTKLRFVEVDEAGQPIGEPKVMTIDGDVLYVDYWVVKFDDKFVEQGNDPLRGASICLLRRLFGEYQQPSEGQVVDAAGQRPGRLRSRRPALGFRERPVGRIFGTTPTIARRRSRPECARRMARRPRSS